MAAFCFFLASISDYYDGYLAKKQGLITDFGKIMDPIADKILMLAIFFVLAHMNVVAWWMVILIALREVLITADRLIVMKKGQVLAAERAGKIKTFFQMTTVSVILIYLILSRSASQDSWFAKIQANYWISIKVLMIITVILTLGSGISYYKNKFKRYSS